MDTRIHQAWFGLRAAFGVVPVVAGLDKYVNLLTNWEQYVSPKMLQWLPFSATALMHIVGIVEVAVGLMILTKWTRHGAYIASGWLIAIALNLLMTGHFFDVAARDAVMAVGAFALARLEEARELGSDERRHSQPIGSPVHG
jgi:uncharacterized membrane protein YphA (DoxX/SURF4 family)